MTTGNEKVFILSTNIVVVLLYVYEALYYFQWKKSCSKPLFVFFLSKISFIFVLVIIRIYASREQEQSYEIKISIMQTNKTYEKKIK